MWERTRFCSVKCHGFHKRKGFNEFIVENGVAFLKTKTGFILIDEKDLVLINKYRWYHNSRGYGYCSIYDTKTKENKHILLHHLLVRKKHKYSVDHINRNRADNRRCNLRLIPQKHNAYNAIYRHTTYSSGITKRKEKCLNKFRASIQIKKKRIYLGSFSSQEEAYNYRKHIIETKYKNTPLIWEYERASESPTPSLSYT